MEKKPGLRRDKGRRGLGEWQLPWQHCAKPGFGSGLVEDMRKEARLSLYYC